MYFTRYHTTEPPTVTKSQYYKRSVEKCHREPGLKNMLISSRLASTIPLSELREVSHFLKYPVFTFSIESVVKPGECFAGMDEDFAL